MTTPSTAAPHPLTPLRRRPGVPAGGRRRAFTLAAGVALAAASLAAAGCGRDPAPTASTATTAISGPSPAETALVQAVSDRLVLAIDVAESKWNTGSPIEDQAREAQAVTSIEAAATAAGVDPAVAAAALRAQIEASKTVQRSLHERWTSEQHPPFAETVDLVNDLRPRLDSATQAMVDALAAGGAPIARDRLSGMEGPLAARLDGVPAAGDAARTALAPFAGPR